MPGSSILPPATMKTKSNKRMTESKAKELEKQELRDNTDQSGSQFEETSIAVQIESNYKDAKVDAAWLGTALNEHVGKGNGDEVFIVTEIKSNPLENSAEAEIDRIVAEQQALLDARTAREKAEKATAEAMIEIEDLKSQLEVLQNLTSQNKSESPESPAAGGSKEFTFTALINFKKYVKVEANTEEEAVRMIEDMKLGEFISKKDMRFDKRENN